VADGEIERTTARDLGKRIGSSGPPADFHGVESEDRDIEFEVNSHGSWNCVSDVFAPFEKCATESVRPS